MKYMLADSKLVPSSCINTKTVTTVTVDSSVYKQCNCTSDTTGSYCEKGW